ncbi:uncharacterized protein LOC135495045 [Lineus longissimus]|uniref:uncharacterized protein LOC135495045 n=1 Tax=Lineus longissimus TaxID=88925 RepID=UPI00315DD56B
MFRSDKSYGRDGLPRLSSQDKNSAVPGHDNILLQRAKAPNPLYKREERRREDDAILAKLDSKKYLSHELKHHYGLPGQDKAVIMYDKSNAVSPGPDHKPKLIQDIMRDRVKERYQKQEERLENMRYLNEERVRLQAARDAIHQKRREYDKKPPSPALSDTQSLPDWYFTAKLVDDIRPDSQMTVRSVDDVIKETKKKYPRDLQKINYLRQNYQREQDRLEKLREPYDGRYGPSSYEPWQMNDYYMCRKIVESEIERFLDTYFKPSTNAYTKEIAQSLLEADKRKADKQWLSLMRDRATQLIAEEFLLEATSELSYEASKEYLYIDQMVGNQADKIVMLHSEIIATQNPEGRDSEDPLYPTVTKAYFRTQEDRRKHKRNIWSHSQHVHTRPVEGEEADEREQEDDDLHMVDFDDISPMELRTTEPHPLDSQADIDFKEHLRRYRTHEVEYWQNIQCSINTIPLSKKMLGVRTAKMSHNHRYFALGSYHGDIVIYDIWQFPWRPVRALYNVNKRVDDPVIDIGWSLDGSQVITINSLGTLNLWSFNAGSISNADLKNLDLVKSDEFGNFTPQLTRQISLDVDDGDFSFKTGPYATLKVHQANYGPTYAAFHPCMTVFGSQRCLCISLENGDVIKCELEARLHSNTPYFVESPRITYPNIRDNYPSFLGSNIEAELFRHHKHPIIHIGFIKKVKHMYTVDNKGYINIWRYSSKEVTEYEWFRPYKKFKIEMNKQMYTPQTGSKPNIVFTDKSRNTNLTKEQVSQFRQEAQEIFDKTNLQNPWHQEYIAEQDLLTQVYKPFEQITESGAMFHILIKHYTTGVLSTYITRLYTPVKVKYTRFYGVMANATEDGLVVLLLFPAHPPKRAHLSVLKFDLMNFKMADYRKDIFIPEQEYQDCLRKEIVHWNITKTYGPTGAEYLFLNKNGDLTAYSLNTGLKILKMVSPKNSKDDAFMGCRINSSAITLPADQKMIISSTQGTIQIMFYGKNQHFIKVLQLKDKNDDETRRTMWKTYTNWEGHHVVPTELRVNPMESYLDDVVHPNVYMRNIILQCMDAAIDKADRLDRLTADELAESKASDRVNNYLALKKEVTGRATPAVSVAGSSHDSRRSTPKGQDPRRQSVGGRRRPSQRAGDPYQSGPWREGRDAPTQRGGERRGTIAEEEGEDGRRGSGGQGSGANGGGGDGERGSNAGSGQRGSVAGR